jgi:NAD(P)-dependent dehydrogenase (short-subunit alcohol dehydrogenase family)
VVTGAGGGLGAAVARTLAAAGSAVSCADRDGDAAARTAAAIRSRGGVARAHIVDVTEPATVAALHSEVLDDLGPVGIVVNSAGIVERRGPPNSTTRGSCGLSRSTWVKRTR